MKRLKRFISASVSMGLLMLIFGSCYSMRRSSGGGQTHVNLPRRLNPQDVALPDGYEIEVVANDFTFPTDVTFDEDGTPYVLEAGYSYGEVRVTPQLIGLSPDGVKTVIAKGEENGPWNGVDYHDGHFYIAEGGHFNGGRILKVSPDGEVKTLVEGLPSYGDHHTNSPLVGPDGWLYFGQGTATNSGVVGVDNAKFGWLKRRPDFHDIPGEDIVLTGTNFTTANPLKEGESVTTGAFSPFGSSTEPGQVIQGEVPCNGSIMRIPIEGGDLELVAWGFRNPYRLAFSPEGQLYAVDNGYDERGSRPIFGSADYLWSVESGKWYGWPDYAGDHAVDEDYFGPPGEDTPELLIKDHPNEPPEPIVHFGVHSSCNGLVFSNSDNFGYQGDAFVAQFGDMAPNTGKVLAPVGFKVVRVDVSRKVVYDFAVNRGKENGPASKIGGHGLERPVSVKFSPDGSELYVVDFGALLHKKTGSEPKEKTGVLWRIRKNQASRKEAR